MTDIPTSSELREWLASTREIAEEAGAILMRGYRNAGGVRHKGEIDLVTEHDLASEALIRERLSAAFPDHGLVGEEGGGKARDGLVWFCDPLDGTTNFAHGLFVFAVSIGLALDGKAILGVVHAPALGLTWSGARGVGAFRNEEMCSVSSTDALSRSLIATGFPYDRASDSENNIAELSRIVLKIRGIRRLGSAATDLCLVADGTYDAYWEQKLKPWDICAGMAILEAAGGRITSYEGGSVDIHCGRLIASNGKIHDVLHAEIDSARREAGLIDGPPVSPGAR